MTTLGNRNCNLQSESLLGGKICEDDVLLLLTLVSRSNNCDMEESDEDGGERGPSFEGVATGVEFNTGTEFKSTSDMQDKLIVEQDEDVSL